MHKWLRKVIAQPSRAPAVKPREAIQHAVLQRVIIFGAGPIFHHTDAETAIFQKLCQSLSRVMIEMMRQGQPKPIFAEMARLIAAEIWQANQNEAARAQ